MNRRKIKHWFDLVWKLFSVTMKMNHQKEIVQIFALTGSSGTSRENKRGNVPRIEYRKSDMLVQSTPVCNLGRDHAAFKLVLLNQRQSCSIFLFFSWQVLLICRGFSVGYFPSDLEWAWIKTKFTDSNNPNTNNPHTHHHQHQTERGKEVAAVRLYIL